MVLQKILIFLVVFFFLAGCITINFGDSSTYLTESPKPDNDDLNNRNTILAITCGNRYCDATENILSCPADCTVFDPACGNFICENGETVSSCNEDCRQIAPDGVCGNDLCEVGESNQNCPTDCDLFDPVGARCGNGVCDGSELNVSCPSDCNVRGAVCGDGSCSLGENVQTCNTDCFAIESFCGNGFCEPGEDLETCSVECSLIDALGNFCGNGTCEAGETRDSCIEDCNRVVARVWSRIPIYPNRDLNAGSGDLNGSSDLNGSIPSNTITCGNGLCETGEASGSCWMDCASAERLATVCGDRICAGVENALTCSEDCVVSDFGDAFPSLSITLSPSNPSQSKTFNLTVTVEDDVGVDQIFWQADSFIPDHAHLNSFDCNLARTCTHAWNDLIAIEEGTILITVYATDSSGQESGRPVMRVNVGPFVPYTVTTSGPVCGNGSCQTGETNVSCPADCVAAEIVSSVCGNDICELRESETCSADCAPKTLRPVCNNNRIEGSEVCDGTSLNGQTCQTQGFRFGTLRCNFICSGYDRSRCSNTAPTVCGNGTCETGETATSCAADCGTSDACSTNSDCGYKQVCSFGRCESVECTNSSQCGSCERCSDNACRSCGYGPFGCYC